MTEEIPAPPKLTAKVAFLLRRAFPEPPEAIETHLSWVFLTTDRAYKLKKPSKHPFLDHRSVEARRIDCEAEVELNELLAPGVYLGTVPLTWDRDRGLAIGGEGKVVDWLIVMRRLAEAAMLDRALAAGTGSVDSGQVEALVRHLLAFYRSTDQPPTTPARYRQSLLEILAIDREELLRPDHALDQHGVVDLTDRLEVAVETDGELGERSSRVVDGHGDLRPEHVLLGQNPLVIDRITFDRQLRLIDPVNDLALLAVECERLGAPELGESILGTYLELAGDPIAHRIVALYRSLRAATRARLSVAHLADDGRDAGKWLDRTDAYLLIAKNQLDRYSREVHR
ncbi:MAG: hypothetical protein GY925_08115 [Actinomycetia bacterium]|nr:hypothetical protein [Actinomycetes bacterium]